jgi:hypothetical protein
MADFSVLKDPEHFGKRTLRGHSGHNRKARLPISKHLTKEGETSHVFRTNRTVESCI